MSAVEEKRAEEIRIASETNLRKLAAQKVIGKMRLTLLPAGKEQEEFYEAQLKRGIRADKRSPYVFDTEIEAEIRVFRERELDEDQIFGERVEVYNKAFIVQVEKIRERELEYEDYDRDFE